MALVAAPTMTMTASGMLGMSSPRGDEASLAIQVQQFLDEWMFRILKSGLSSEWDQTECITRALEIFEANGLDVASEEEKERIAGMEEEDMCMAVVQLMPESMKKNFESFTLQLKLVISTVTRVRSLLEEGTDADIAICLEDGDQGISQQVLKSTVIEASKEVAQMKDIHRSWDKSVALRVARLHKCADDMEQANSELTVLEREINAFGGEQNNKTKKVLMGMAAGQDKALLQVVMSTWATWYAKYKAEKGVHDKWRSQVDDAKKKLMEYKMQQKGALKGVLKKKFMDHEQGLKSEAFKEWLKFITLEKEEREISGQLAEAEARLRGIKESQKENAKKTMMKVAGASEASLVDFCFQEWVKFLAEQKKDKATWLAVQASEKKLLEFKEQKKESAKAVLGRMMGGTESGLLYMCMNAWVEDYTAEKKGREMEQKLNAVDSKFQSLRNRQKDGTRNRTQSANELDNLNLLMQIFMNWSTEARLGYIMKHYGDKMNKKKHQLEQVQQMFKTFATQLEQGIGNTPRSQRKTQRGKSEDPSGARPPLAS